MPTDAPRTPPVTRLAPSPTGALHLGNARTFLINWALARQNSWHVTLRIEDLDTPRTKKRADEQAIAVLRWLGMDWDSGPTYQADDLSRYRAALDEMGKAGLIYPCTCTRKDIEQAQSAPHDGGDDPHETRYPGTHRPDAITPVDTALDDPSVAWRLRVPDEPITFVDAFCGEQAFNLDRITGDFIVAAKSGLPAYQLAVVIDDAAARVTQVVRGDDLLSSTPRQMLIYHYLGLSPLPRYTHVPLVLGEDGRRLAKRHGDTRLVSYMHDGVPAERVVGLIARWCGIGDPTRREVFTAAEFARAYDPAKMSRQPVTFTTEDDAWLRDATP